MDAGIEDCGGSPFGAQQVTVNVLLVIDKSASMTEVPGGFSDDKWTALGTSLEDALDSVKESIHFGLELFPFPDACEVATDEAIRVPIGSGSETVPTILETLTTTTPTGGTPTAAALAQALDYFSSGAGKELAGERYVLLATDGGPNCNSSLTCGVDECVPNLEGRCPESLTNCCNAEEGGPGAPRGCLDDDETLAQIEALAAAGVGTFVVGIPGSEIFADSPDAFAEAGTMVNPDGPPSYFAVDEPEALSDVLRSITRSLVTSCKLQLESEPPDDDLLNVEVEDELVPPGADGWTLDTSTSPPTIVIEGTTCERIETQGVESVNVIYGCPTVIF